MVAVNDYGIPLALVVLFAASYVVAVFLTALYWILWILQPLWWEIGHAIRSATAHWIILGIIRCPLPAARPADQARPAQPPAGAEEAPMTAVDPNPWRDLSLEVLRREPSAYGTPVAPEPPFSWRSLAGHAVLYCTMWLFFYASFVSRRLGWLLGRMRAYRLTIWLLSNPKWTVPHG